MTPFIVCAMCTLFGYLLCYWAQVRPLDKDLEMEKVKFRRARLCYITMAFKIRRLQAELHSETQFTDNKQAD